MEKFVQVGICGLRDPMTGEVIDNEPLYIKVHEDGKMPQGFTAGEKEALNGIAGILANKHKAYIAGVKKKLGEIEVRDRLAELQQRDGKNSEV